LVILANFSDKSFAVGAPKTAFQNLLTQSGYSAYGGTGSVKDYFLANSDGKFAPDFETFGPVTLAKKYAYYGAK
jgi:M6 family metalloprotease-like protein